MCRSLVVWYLNNSFRHHLTHSHLYRNIQSFLQCWCNFDYSHHYFHHIHSHLLIMYSSTKMCRSLVLWYLNNSFRQHLTHSHLYRNIQSFLQCWCNFDYSHHYFHHIHSHLFIMYSSTKMCRSLVVWYLNNSFRHHLTHSHLYRNIQSFLQCWCNFDYSHHYFHHIHSHLLIMYSSTKMCRSLVLWYLNNSFRQHLKHSHLYRNIQSFLQCWCNFDYSHHYFHHIHSHLLIMYSSTKMCRSLVVWYLNNSFRHHLTHSHLYRNIQSFLQCWCNFDYSHHYFHHIHSHLLIMYSSTKMCRSLVLWYLNNSFRHHLTHSHLYRNIQSFLQCWCNFDYSHHYFHHIHSHLLIMYSSTKMCRSLVLWYLNNSFRQHLTHSHLYRNIQSFLQCWCNFDYSHHYFHHIHSHLLIMYSSTKMCRSLVVWYLNNSFRHHLTHSHLYRNIQSFLQCWCNFDYSHHYFHHIHSHLLIMYSITKMCRSLVVWYLNNSFRHHLTHSHLYRNIQSFLQCWCNFDYSHHYFHHIHSHLLIMYSSTKMCRSLVLWYLNNSFRHHLTHSHLYRNIQSFLQCWCNFDYSHHYFHHIHSHLLIMYSSTKMCRSLVVWYLNNSFRHHLTHSHLYRNIQSFLQCWCNFDYSHHYFHHIHSHLLIMYSITKMCRSLVVWYLNNSFRHHLTHSHLYRNIQSFLQCWCNFDYSHHYFHHIHSHLLIMYSSTKMCRSLVLWYLNNSFRQHLKHSHLYRNIQSFLQCWCNFDYSHHYFHHIHSHLFIMYSSTKMCRSLVLVLWYLNNLFRQHLKHSHLYRNIQSFLQCWCNFDYSHHYFHHIHSHLFIMYSSTKMCRSLVLWYLNNSFRQHLKHSHLYRNIQSFLQCWCNFDYSHHYFHHIHSHLLIMYSSTKMCRSLVLWYLNNSFRQHLKHSHLYRNIQSFLQCWCNFDYSHHYFHHIHSHLLIMYSSTKMCRSLVLWYLNNSFRQHLKHSHLYRNIQSFLQCWCNFDYSHHYFHHIHSHLLIMYSITKMCRSLVVWYLNNSFRHHLTHSHLYRNIQSFLQCWCNFDYSHHYFHHIHSHLLIMYSSTKMCRSLVLWYLNNSFRQHLKHSHLYRNIQSFLQCWCNFDYSHHYFHHIHSHLFIMYSSTKMCRSLVLVWYLNNSFRQHLKHSHLYRNIQSFLQCWCNFDYSHHYFHHIHSHLLIMYNSTKMCRSLVLWYLNNSFRQHLKHSHLYRNIQSFLQCWCNFDYSHHYFHHIHSHLLIMYSSTKMCRSLVVWYLNNSFRHHLTHSHLYRNIQSFLQCWCNFDYSHHYFHHIHSHLLIMYSSTKMCRSLVLWYLNNSFRQHLKHSHLYRNIQSFLQCWCNFDYSHHYFHHIHSHLFIMYSSTKMCRSLVLWYLNNSFRQHLKHSHLYRNIQSFLQCWCNFDYSHHYFHHIHSHLLIMYSSTKMCRSLVVWYLNNSFRHHLTHSHLYRNIQSFLQCWCNFDYSHHYFHHIHSHLLIMYSSTKMCRSLVLWYLNNSFRHHLTHSHLYRNIQSFLQCWCNFDYSHHYFHHIHSHLLIMYSSTKMCRSLVLWYLNNSFRQHLKHSHLYRNIQSFLQCWCNFDYSHHYFHHIHSHLFIMYRSIQ